jgi:biotin carboxyl carrier protein
MKYTAIVDGESLDLRLIRSAGEVVEAQVGEERYVLEVDVVEPGVYWFRWNNRSIEVSIIRDGEAYSVSIGNQYVSVEIVDARAKLRKTGQAGRDGAVEIRAPMPGRVVRVLANEGETVEVNQGLLVIEAMKMQNEMKSPKRGVLRKLGVQEFTAVSAGDLLAVVE